MESGRFRGRGGRPSLPAAPPRDCALHNRGRARHKRRTPVQTESELSEALCSVLSCLMDVEMNLEQAISTAAPALVGPHPPARLPAVARCLQPAAAAARLCLRLSDKAAGRAGGVASTARAGHGGALRLHQVPPALPLRGAVSGAAAVQGARAGAAAGSWDAGGAALVLRGRPAGPPSRAWQALPSCEAAPAPRGAGAARWGVLDPV